jgi:REP element-mobilizing transposase RayT
MSNIKYRLKYFDYSSSNYYFITINTYKKEKYFGKIVNNEMIYNNNGKIVLSEKDIIFDKNVIEIMCFQLMPNHIHMIIELKKDGKIELKNAISYFKSILTRKINDIDKLWARGYYDRVIRNEKEYRNIYNYIINNPYMDKYKW